MTPLQDALRIALIGIGATAFMDAWLMLLGRLGVATLNFSMIGRWVGHLARGRFFHAAIGRAEPVAGERALGWLVHYGIGIAFAAVLVLAAGLDWSRRPTFAPALTAGVLTVAAPLFVMQPAMGAGIASTRTAAPLKNTLRSLANHTVFGIGLYLSAAVVAWSLR